MTRTFGYLKSNLLRSLRSVLFITLGLIAFQGLLIAAYEAVESSELVEFLIAQLEKNLNSTPGRLFFLTDPDTYVALAWRHPLILIMLASFAVGRGTAAVAGEIEAGTGDLLFTRPVDRWRLLFPHWLATTGSLAAICILGSLGTIFWLWYSAVPEPPAPWAVFQIGITAFLLMAVIAGYSYFFSALSWSRSEANGLAVAATLLFYAVEVLGDIRTEFEALKPYSIFYYYQPFDILRGRAETFFPLIVLALPALLLLIASCYLIESRDL